MKYIQKGKRWKKFKYKFYKAADAVNFLHYRKKNRIILYYFRLLCILLQIRPFPYKYWKQFRKQIIYADILHFSEFYQIMMDFENSFCKVDRSSLLHRYLHE